MKNFTNLILGLGIGIEANDVFCTSIEDMTMRNGDDIRQHIKENILSADYSFLMLSKNYQSSEICLNEMGAVWRTLCIPNHLIRRRQGRQAKHQSKG